MLLLFPFQIKDKILPTLFILHTSPDNSGCVSSCRSLIWLWLYWSGLVSPAGTPPYPAHFLHTHTHTPHASSLPYSLSRSFCLSYLISNNPSLPSSFKRAQQNPLLHFEAIHPGVNLLVSIILSAGVICCHYSVTNHFLLFINHWLMRQLHVGAPHRKTVMLSIHSHGISDNNLLNFNWKEAEWTLIFFNHPANSVREK